MQGLTARISFQRRQTVIGTVKKDTHETWDRQNERKQDFSASIEQGFKALQGRPLEVRQEPFQGFKSPPGRF